MVEAQQLIGGCRRHDAPGRQRAPNRGHRGELTTGVDIAVVDVEELRRDARPCGSIPFGMLPDGSIGSLLAVGRRHQCRLPRRRVTQRVLVGDQVVGQLCGIRRQPRLCTIGRLRRSRDRHGGRRRCGRGRRCHRPGWLGAAGKNEHERADGYRRKVACRTTGECGHRLRTRPVGAAMGNRLAGTTAAARALGRFPTCAADRRRFPRFG